MRLDCLTKKKGWTPRIPLLGGNNNNAWLSGFTDADGNFNLSITKRKAGSLRVQLNYRLELTQNYMKKANASLGQSTSFHGICSAIAAFFDASLYDRTRQVALKKNKTLLKEYSFFIVMTCNLKSNGLVCNYFDQYPLFSSKRLNYIDWRHVHQLMVTKNHLTSEGRADYLRIKSNFNQNRTTFTWDHLYSFYAEKK